MTLHAKDLHTLCQLAIKAAKAAGALISSYTDQPIQIHKKNAGSSAASQLVTEVDFKSQDLILKMLQPSIKTYDLAILTEEQPDYKDRLQKDYFWCIDPLDGTLAFTEGTSGYAVSIALVAKNGVPQMGVVYDPVTHTLYHAIKNQGAYKNEKQWQRPKPAPDKPLEFYFNRSFKSLKTFPKVLTALQDLALNITANGVHVNPSSGAVMNACLALENGPSCYVAFPKKTAGGGSLWDYAATASIYQEMGAVVTTIFGTPLDLNPPDTTFMNTKGVLFASDLTLSKKVQQLYAQIKQT